jgi:alanyl-tRNA synthetase
MLDDKLDFQDLLIILKTKREIPEKIAQVKALQRVQIIQEGNWLIGLTYVGSFEANVATSLLKIGFDIGIVYSEKKTTFRITTRANKKICLETGLHLGKILEEISTLCEGSGGGHDGAASINGKTGLKITIDKIIEKIKQILSN